MATPREMTTTPHLPERVVTLWGSTHAVREGGSANECDCPTKQRQINPLPTKGTHPAPGNVAGRGGKGESHGGVEMRLW